MFDISTKNLNSKLSCFPVWIRVVAIKLVQFIYVITAMALFVAACIGVGMTVMLIYIGVGQVTLSWYYSTSIETNPISYLMKEECGGPHAIIGLFVCVAILLVSFALYFGIPELKWYLTDEMNNLKKLDTEEANLRED